MSDEANLSKRRGPRFRWRAYVDGWLLSTFLVLAGGTLWFVGERAKGAAPDTHLGGLLLASAVIGLLGVPALWLLRLFPERAASGWLRFIRRLLVALPCGMVPTSLLAGMTAGRTAESAGGAWLIWGCGPLFGIVAALVDTMDRDRQDDDARVAAAEDDVAA